MDIETKEALDWATNRLTKLPSVKTQDQYIKIYKRLHKNLEIAVLPGTAKNRNTRSVERSAFRYYAARMITKNHLTNPTYVKAIFNIVKVIGDIALKAQQKYSASSKGIPRPCIQVRDSQRSSINGLVNWRENLIVASSKSEYADAIRVMAICGCRPSELEKGVVLERQENTITITVKGSKCSNNTDAGQVTRTLTFDSNHPLIGDIPAGTYKAKAHGIQDAVSHYGRKIEHHKNDPLSAYSFRHAAASDFKASGLSDQDIAAALGHRSTATMQFYAIYRGGSGMVKLTSVLASNPVRNVSKVTTFNNKTKNTI